MLMNMLRTWPIVCEFAVGAVLCLIGIVCGLRGKYLDIKLAEDKRFLITLIVGYLLLLALVCFFTFLAPNFSNGETI